MAVVRCPRAGREIERGLGEREEARERERNDEGDLLHLFWFEE